MAALLGAVDCLDARAGLAAVRVVRVGSRTGASGRLGRKTGALVRIRVPFQSGRAPPRQGPYVPACWTTARRQGAAVCRWESNQENARDFARAGERDPRQRASGESPGVIGPRRWASGSI